MSKARSLRGVTKEQRQRWKRVLYERQNGLCHWCQKIMVFVLINTNPVPDDTATFEHLIPKSKGGKDSFHNLVLAHRKCNKIRGSHLF